MRNSDLYKVFSSLSPTEKRSLSKFLESPFFNKRQEVTAFWKYLLANAKYGAPALKKEKVFGVLFSGKAYDDSSMRHLMSWLLKSIEQFLAYSEYKTTPNKETLHLAKAYNKKGLTKLYQKSIRLAEKHLGGMKRDEDFFHYNYLLEYEKYQLAQNQQRSKEANFNEMTLALDKHLLINKFKQACILRSHQLVIKKEYDFSLIELLLDYIPKSNYINEPGVAAYYNCYLALTFNDEAAFQNLKGIIQHEQVSFTTEDLKMLYFSSINFSIKKLNTGDKKYIREAFELYQLGLEDNLLTIDGVLSQFAYNNIVSIGLKLDEFNWLKSFIPDYKNQLLPKHRESNYTYNLARLNFNQRNYDEAMVLLQKVDDRDLLLNLDAKVILLKLFYELQEYDALSSLLASFKVMLTRKKVLGYHKKHYSNIIRFTNRLLNLKPRDKKASDKLRNDILTAEVLQEKEWLLEQLQLMK